MSSNGHDSPNDSNQGRGVGATCVTPPQVADHELIRIIGSGGYGDVWLARNIMGVYRAVKVVFRARFESERPYEREFAGIQRFEPISRSHESQVNILHVGRGEDCFFYVMELADPVEPVADSDVALQNATEVKESTENGSQTTRLIPVDPDTYQPRTLRSEFKSRGRLPFDDCLEIGLALTKALDHLHANGLVHRDIKPSNIIFVNGRPKLADIGLVADTDATVSFVGTEGYIPPEGPGRPQADVYSLGKTLYEIVTGRDRADFPELPTLLKEETDRSGLGELNEVVLRACEERAQDRYSSARAMHEDLLQIQGGRSVRRMHYIERQLRLFRRVAGAAVVVLGLVALFFYQAKLGERRANAQASKAIEARALDYVSTSRHAEALPYLEEALTLAADDEKWRLSRLASTALQQIPERLQSFDFPEGVQHATYHPDGQHLFVCSGSNALVVSADTGEILRQFGPSSTVDLFEVQTNGNHVALTLDGSTEIEIWDWTDGSRVQTLSGHDDLITQIEFLPDGRRIVSGGNDGRIKIWDLSSGESDTPWSYIDPLNLVFSMSVDPTGAFLAVSFRWVDFVGRDAEVLRVYDLNDLDDDSPIIEMEHSRGGGEVVFSPDGRWLAMLRGNRGLNVYDTLDWSLIDELPFYEHELTGLRFSPDSRRLAVALPDGEIEMLDMIDGTVIARRAFHGGKIAPGSMRFSPDGRLLTSASVDGPRIRIADSGTLQDVMSAIPTDDVATEIVFHPTMPVFLSAEARSGSMNVWDYHSTGPVWSRHFSRRFLNAVDWNPKTGSLLIAHGGGPSWGNAGSVFQWINATDASTNVVTWPTNGSVTRIAFNTAGDRIIAATWLDALQDGRNRRAFWLVAPDEPVVRLPWEIAGLGKDGVFNVGFSEDGGRCFVATIREVVVFDVANASQVQSLTPPPATADANAISWNPRFPTSLKPAEQWEFASAKISPRGKLMAAATASVLMVWEIDTGKLVLESPISPVFDLLWTPDERRLVSFHDRDVGVWSLDEPGGPSTLLAADTGTIYEVSLSHAGDRLLTSSSDNRIRCWEVESGQLLWELETRGAAVQLLEWSPDDRLFVSVESQEAPWHKDPDPDLWFRTEEGQTIRILESTTHRPASVPLNLATTVRLVGLDQNGDHVVVVLADGTAQRFEIAAQHDVLNRLRQKTDVLTEQGGSAVEAIRLSQRFTPEAMLDYNINGAWKALIEERWSTLAWFARRLSTVSSDSDLIDSFLDRAARRDFPEGSPDASEGVIDLSPYYNVPLTGLERPKLQARNAFGLPGWGLYFNCRGKIPQGTFEIDGIPFDVRGSMTLDWRRTEGAAMQYGAWSFPRRVMGIPVGRKAARLHFLQTTFLPHSENGDVIGRYRIRYQDGEMAEAEIIYGENVDHIDHHEDCNLPGVKQFFEFPEAVRARGLAPARFHVFSWENPRPDATIMAIDFESTMSRAMPVLFAITVEPLQ